MSFILDALQKSSAEDAMEHLNSQPQATSASMGLGWKIAIGAVLASNLLFLYLWQSDRAPEAVEIARHTEPQLDAGTHPENTANGASTQGGYAKQSGPKKTLPGIASPRDLPLPKPAATPSAGSARTFRPTGAPITIADATPSVDPVSARVAIQPSDSQLSDSQSSDIQPTDELEPIQAPTTVGRGVSQLHELSASAREALYVLTFSIHIYSEDVDLRAVVVNGERLLEGNKVVADNGQSFRLLEIFDTGVIMQFDHEGATETVQIPVNDDWKEA